MKKSYHKTTLGKVDADLRSGLLTALLNFAESAFQINSIEYLEGGKFVIAFINDTIRSEDSIQPELLLSYVIMDKEKKIDKYVQKKVQPMLHKLSDEFKHNNADKNLSEVSQFKYFKNNIDAIFYSDSKNVDQKLQGLFY